MEGKIITTQSSIENVLLLKSKNFNNDQAGNVVSTLNSFRQIGPSDLRVDTLKVNCNKSEYSFNSTQHKMTNPKDFNLEEIEKEQLIPIQIPKSNKSHFVMKVNKEDMQSIFFKHKELTVSNYKLNNTLGSDKRKYDQLNDHIQQLNNDIEEIKLENEAMLFSRFNESLEKQHLEISQKEITDYCNDMKRKSMNVENTISEYEKVVASRKVDIEEIKKEYEYHIQQSKAENKKTATENEEFEFQSDQLRNKIREYEIKIELVQKEIETEKASFNERDLLNRIKYENLEAKYAELQKKAFALQEERRKKSFNRLPIDSSKNYKVKKAKKLHAVDLDEVKLKILEIDQQNSALQNSVEDKKKYLAELQNSLKAVAEKQNQEPSYLRSKKVIKDKPISTMSTRPQTARI